MQTIKTEHGTYKISDTRDAGEFMRQLAKPKKRARIPKQSVRHFPMFIPGQTSVREYVRSYLAGNKEQADEAYFLEHFAQLPTTPAQCYDPTMPLCEVTYEQ